MRKCRHGKEISKCSICRSQVRSSSSDDTLTILTSNTDFSSGGSSDSGGSFSGGGGDSGGGGSSGSF